MGGLKWKPRIPADDVIYEQLLIRPLARFGLVGKKISFLCCILEEREDDLFILSFETTPFFFS